MAKSTNDQHIVRDANNLRVTPCSLNVSFVMLPWLIPGVVVNSYVLLYNNARLS